MTIELTTIVARRPGALSAPVDDEIVIFNPDHDNYLGLDRIGRAVWELIEKPQRVSDLCVRLSADFEATPDVIAADVLHFLTETADEGIVRVVEG
jgi:hypothetical protein